MIRANFFLSRQRLCTGSFVAVRPHPFPGVFVGEEEGPGGWEGPDDGRGETVVEGAQSFASVNLEPKTEHWFRRSRNLGGK